jgi:hypothetical protein
MSSQKYMKKDIQSLEVELAKSDLILKLEPTIPMEAKTPTGIGCVPTF